MATLQGNKNKEGVHLVVPPEFANFFIASASAGAALVGLLFVAVSIAPEQLVTRRAPMERQAVAGSAFTALMNAFFISLVALIPHFNIGFIIVPFISVCLVTTLIQAWQLLRLRKGWLSLLRRTFLVLLGVPRYGLLGWLNPLRDVQNTESFERAGNSHSAAEQPKTEEAAPRSPSQ